MPFIDSLEYLNLNSLRNYPIRDGLNRTDVTGAFVIPQDFIVDFQLAASSDVTQRYYISQVFNQVTQFLLEISDSTNTVVGSFVIPVANFVNNSDFYLQTTPGNYQYASGRITIGSLLSILNQPAGIFSFTINNSEFLSRTIIVSVAAINQFTFTDSKGNTQSLTNVVNVVARNNLRYSYDSVHSLLILDAGDGLGLNTQCKTITCVQSINGVTPDPSTGNISFIGLDCSNISTNTPATLQLNDSCCTPCSGCNDLSTLTSRVNQLELSANNLKNFYSYLNTQLTAFTNTVNSNCVCPS